MTSGPVGIITGGLSGIGAACALEFAGLGGRMALTDVSLEGAEVLLELVERAGGEALSVLADVREPRSHESVVQHVLEKWGRIDFVVSNAGIAEQTRIATGDPELWRAVAETNLLGTIYTVHTVLPTMLDQGCGHVFIMSSTSGRESYVGEPVYVASKWGLVGFAHALRLELQDAGIRVTCVEPGIVDTPLTRDNPKVQPLLDACEPLTPDDVARVVVFAYLQPQRVAISEIVIRPQRDPPPHLGAAGGASAPDISGSAGPNR
ncbi:MAG: SDR family oxidoreductase [Acidimicrobiales bacterium]